MQTPEIRRTEVDLDGLLEVLGENLYSTPIVAVRELIQNGFDACIRRRAESDWQQRGELRLYCDDARSIVEIEDNGSGLTRQEIIEFLATIGSGYTRVLRRRTEDEMAVGYFGLGFLTAYVVADLVEFETSSYQTADLGWHFSSKGGVRYQLRPTPPRAIGSRVRLHLKEAFATLADSEFLALIVRRYCCLLPIDIYLNDGAEPVNRIEIPWQLPTEMPELRRKKAGLAFAELFDHSFEPMVTFPVVGDEQTKLNGLLWIQDGAFYASSDNRVTSIFIRSMHITNECKALLPEWAGFVGCVIDTPLLTPTASRESVREDPEFDEIKALIASTLVSYLAALPEQDEPVWRRIVARHNQGLLGAAVSDEELFQAMHRKLRLPTSEGELSIDEILQRSPDRLLRLTMEEVGGYEQLIAKSRGIPVIYGYRYAVSRFCRQLAAQMTLELVTLGSAEDSTLLFPETESDAETTQALTQLFARSGLKLMLSRFEPNNLPLVQLHDQDALLKKRLESDEMDRHLGMATLMLAREFSSNLSADNEAYLYLNLDNELIQQLVTLDPAVAQMLAGLMLDISRLASGHAEAGQQSALESINHHLSQLTAQLAANRRE